MRSYKLCIFYNSEMNSLMQGKIFKNSKQIQKNFAERKYFTRKVVQIS